MTKIIIAGGNDHYVSEKEPGTPLVEVFPSYGVTIVMEETSQSELEDLKSDLPTDTHLVTYRTPQGDVGADAVRAYTKADIFDAYHDAKLTIVSIANGFGSIKPKLFNDKANQ